MYLGNNAKAFHAKLPSWQLSQELAWLLLLTPAHVSGFLFNPPLGQSLSALARPEAY